MSNDGNMKAILLEKVPSYDGTPIAFHRSGSGPALVLVAGAGGAGPAAWTVIPRLQEHFTVYAVDRRGHGESGDAPIYAIEREFEDIAAVVDSIGEPVNLLGHSYGGLCALEAALLTHNIRKLILYEALEIPVPGVPVYPEGLIDHLESLLEAGDVEGVLTTHYLENVGMSPLEMEQMRLSPAWPARLAAARTLPRELRADDQYRFDAQRFKDLQTPTLLLAGDDNPASIIKGSETVAAALPNSRIAVMPGQGHIAMYTAPDLFVHEVLKFLKGPLDHSLHTR